MNLAFGQRLILSSISNSAPTVSVQLVALLPDEVGRLFVWGLRKPVIKEVTQM